MKKLIILLLVFLTACSVNTNSSQYVKEKTFLGYIADSNNDMVLLLNTEVYLTTVNSNLKDKMIETAKKEIIKYHKLLDSHHTYLDESGKELINITVLNEFIGKGPITVDPIIIEALEEAINLSKLSRGYFNFTVGELSNLYQDKLLPYDTVNEDPNEKDIKTTLNGVIPVDKMDSYIIINNKNNTVELKENSFPYLLDLGAFSKGYIIDKVYDELIKYGSSFLLNAGASSIVTYTSEKENIDWTISINNPKDKEDQLLAFSLNNGAVSTSGDYENYYYLKDGTKRHHILNPFTGYSENYYNSITLTSNNACIIDALSTALFNVQKEIDFIDILEDFVNYYNTDIEFSYIQGDLNIFMDYFFSKKIVGSIPLSNKYTVTTTIIEH